MQSWRVFRVARIVACCCCSCFLQPGTVAVCCNVQQVAELLFDKSL